VETSGTPNTSRYGQVCRPTQQMIESREQSKQQRHYFAYAAND
jgi:hypothetical protein